MGTSGFLLRHVARQWCRVIVGGGLGLADLVLLAADPLADIHNTTTIRAVVANGHYYNRAVLDWVLGTSMVLQASTPQRSAAP